MKVCEQATWAYPDGRTGTYAGWGAHMYAGEPPCAPCDAAARLYKSANESQPHNRAKKRDRTRRHYHEVRGPIERAERRAKREQRAVEDVETRRRYEFLIAAVGSCVLPTRKFPGGLTGTANGYQAHFKHGEPACPACKRAHSRYEAQRRAAKNGRTWKPRNPTEPVEWPT